MEVMLENDFQKVCEFRRLEGAAWRPRNRVARVRALSERRALAAAIPEFSFSALRAALQMSGEDPGPILESDRSFGDEIDARDWSQSILEELSRAEDTRAKAIVRGLRRLHDSLVLERPLSGPADLISCPGSRTLSRIVSAARLWSEAAREHDPRILVSGGQASFDAEASARISVREADAYRSCLRLWSIPDEAIISEREATNTVENAAFVEDIVCAEALRRARPLRLLLVTSGFHTTRYLLSILRRQRLRAATAEIGIAAGPSFLGETLVFDEGGQRAVEKMAIVLNEHLKLHFDLTRESLP